MNFARVVFGSVLVSALTAGAFQDRFFYTSCSFGREASVGQTTNLISRAARAGYNGVVLAGGLDYLPWMAARQRDNVDRVLAAAADAGIEVIPLIWGCGYGAMQGVDRNLAEGIPVRGQPAVVKGGRLVYSCGSVPASRMKFRAWDKNVSGTDPWTFYDFASNPHGHSRVCCHLSLESNRFYRASIEVRQIGLKPFGALRFQGYTDLLKKGGKSASVFSSLPIRHDDRGEWKTVSQTFVTRDRDDFDLIFGSWGGREGSIEMRNLRVEEIGLKDALRRPGCPLTVRTKAGRVVTDVAELPDGTEVLVDGYVAAQVGASQRPTCMSEPKLYELFERSAAALEAKVHPKRVLLSQDEVRAGGTCAACAARHASMARILGECVTRQHAILRRHSPNVTVYIWADMFNPFVNARDNYFACAGTFEDSWKYIPRDIVMADWNGPEYSKALPFWQAHGFRVLGATYYDTDTLDARAAPDVANLRRFPNVTGVMYTTWRCRFELLEPFADAFFGKRHGQPPDGPEP